MLAAVSAHIVNAQTEYRPEFKDYRNSDGQTLVNIDNPETRAQQYHTVDFDRSKYYHRCKRKPLVNDIDEWLELTK